MLPGIVLLLLVWAILVAGRGGDPVVAWSIGAFAAVLAAGWFTRHKAAAGTRMRLRALPAFLLHFFGRSILAGIDVAGRALWPGQRVRPGFLDYHTRLPEGPWRTLFIACIGLLPGTLVVGVKGKNLRVHLLDFGLAAHSDIAALESRIAALVRKDS